MAFISAICGQNSAVHMLNDLASGDFVAQSLMKMNENARILSAFENRLRAGFV